jgi:hypothetical protein
MLQPFPLKRNLIPRFMNGGGAQETMKNNSMIDANQGVYLIGSERYATLLKKIKQGFETTREAFVIPSFYAKIKYSSYA